MADRESRFVGWSNSYLPIEKAEIESPAFVKYAPKRIVLSTVMHVADHSEDKTKVDHLFTRNE